jgi:hypothetical protein
MRIPNKVPKIVFQSAFHNACAEAVFNAATACPKTQKIKSNRRIENILRKLSKNIEQQSGETKNFFKYFKHLVKHKKTYNIGSA